jgi:UDP-3-O-[3-hydroxymyristoyl] glucosamine N-acyltransferase
MKLKVPHTLHQIAEMLNLEYVGDSDHLITGINEIHRVEAGDLSFVDVDKYYSKALNSAATTIIINQSVEAPTGKGLLISADPFSDYNRLTEFFQPNQPFIHSAKSYFPETTLVGQQVIIGKNVIIGEHVTIGHQVVIGNDVHIGDHSVIMPNVTIFDHTFIGQHVLIQPGAVIGSEAFYYKKRPDRRDQMLSKGTTILEDHVHIGANTTIDRGVSAETRIGAHTKIDNLVQIGHDTVIGKRCVIAAQVGIAGVCIVEDDVIIWGQVGIASGIHIGAQSVIKAQSGVMTNLEGNQTYFGSPAKYHIKQLREYVALEQLPDLMKELKPIVNDSTYNR